VKKAVCAAIAIFGCILWAVGCGGSSSVDGISGPGATAGAAGSAGVGSGSPGAGGTNGTGGGATGGSGGGGVCKLAGDSCTGNGDCCSGSCDAQTHVCSNSIGPCKAPASSCTVPQDCCTFVCNAGTCGSTQCTSDNQACTSSAQCCSGNCNATAGAAGACVPLNGSCRTGGNACTDHGQCCSKFCTNGVCSVGGSYCTQTGDVCASDFECCGGLCNKVAGATVGLCRQPSAPGTTGCTVAGEVCGVGLVTADGGLPSCGGSCCSRACAPYKTGVQICQPPSGCRPTGEVCRGDADCCGFGGVQGQTGVGNCSKANASDPVGRCDNGNACRPAGAICKLASMSCNAENNCCAGNVNQNPLVCQQDLLGIPRCTMKGEGCSDAGSRTGQACATSADCCGLPCVPNPAFVVGSMGVPPFVCGAGECVGTGASCTTGADCCPGLPCIMQPGSTRGTCGGAPPPPPPPPGDAGQPPLPDGGTPPGNDAGVPPGCANYGQICTVSGDCCNGIPCNGGRCVLIVN